MKLQRTRSARDKKETAVAEGPGWGPLLLTMYMYIYVYMDIYMYGYMYCVCICISWSDLGGISWVVASVPRVRGGRWGSLILFIRFQDASGENLRLCRSACNWAS